MSGLSISPAIGEAVAAWIVNGKTPMELSLLAPGREGEISEELLKVACRLHYAHHYWEEVSATPTRCNSAYCFSSG